MFLGAAGVWLLLILIAAAVALAVLARPRMLDDAGNDGHADAILKERPAAGEIDETEYRERSAVLDAHRRPRPKGTTPWAVVAVVAAVGALVLLVAAATGWSGGGRWAPMGGPMPGMQDMHGMMGPHTSIDGEAPATIPDATEITVEAGDLWFAPDRLEFTAGEAVNLTVINRGRVFHDLVVDELNLRVNVEAGDTVTAGLQVERPSEYEFYCSVPGHAAGGMRGTLVVRPASS